MKRQFGRNTTCLAYLMEVMVRGFGVCEAWKLPERFSGSSPNYKYNTVGIVDTSSVL